MGFFILIGLCRHINFYKVMEIMLRASQLGVGPSSQI